MKKRLLCLFVAAVATALSLNARVVLIDEGFENGIQEDVWTQEFVLGNTPWMVESDHLSWPSTTVQGVSRAYLRNTTGETEGYATRLISKVMDLRPTKVYMPELTFYYSNPKWGADRDTLRVLYRTGARAAWKQLAELASPTAEWQRVQLALPEVGQTYQIAFEGKDNLGRGIVLDSIKLQSAPECTIPYDITVFNKGAGKVNIAWTGNYDADYYELIVAKDTIDPYNLDNVNPDRIAFHELLFSNYRSSFNYDLILESGEFYLVYVRSVCENENSAWSSEATEEGPFGFRVRMTKQVPFTETFNYPSGVTRDPDWSWGSNTGNQNPFVNSATTGSARARYSPDATAAVIFSGGTMTQLTTAIAADHYAYLATPALLDTTNEDFKVNQCQVHFWSTVYTNTGRKFGRSLMVGVMDDPDDITTFTPVDTVSVWGNMTFQENIVDLGSYTGNGAYVAFVSDFDRDNLFYIDNLTIEYKQQINKVTKITVNPRDTYADISWEGNASSYNVLITNAEVNPANPSAEAIIDQAVVNSNNYRCEVLEAGHSWNRPYYVYVQAAGKEWSYRYPFVTIAAQRAIPYSFDFEATTTTTYTIPGTSGQYAEGLGIFGNSGSYPAVEVSTQKSYAGSGSLYLSLMGGKDGWITLPMVEDLSNVQVKFYLSGYNTYDQAHATIGVMTNPMDINTFIPVADYQLNTTGYTRCYANFQNYNGPDGVIAIVWADVMNMSKFTNNYIDDLVVEELSECVPPTNLDLSIEPDSITVRWESALSDEWEFFLSRIPLRESDRIHKTLDEIQAMSGVVVAQTLTWPDPSSTPQYGFGGLNPHSNYYLYVRATCDPEWWTEMAFSTPCRDETYPYKEMFEGYTLGGSNVGCWQLADYLGVDYPKIYQAGTSSSSNRVLELYSSGTIHRSVAIMPTVEGSLSSMLLSFDARAYSAASPAVVIVGTMGDIADPNSFVPFDTVYVSGSSFTKHRFVLANYDLQYDNIAFTSGLGNTLLMSSDVLIDNVELKDPSCIEAYDFIQTDFAPHSFDLAWSGTSDNDQWELKVLSSNVSVNAVKNGTYSASLAVVNDTVITGKNFHLEGLRAQYSYYVYIRVLCGDSTWTMTPVETSCELLDPAKPNKETFESYSSGEGTVPNCWTVGNANPNASSTYIPYIYSGSSYGNGNKALRLYGYSPYSYAPAWAASPQIKCDSLSTIMVSFVMGAGTSYRGIFGVMSDPNDISTFVTIDSLQGTGMNVTMTYDLSEYASLIPSSARYVAWRTRYGSTDYVYIDDVSFVSVACPLTKPTISELTGSSVRVSSGLRTDDEWILLITNNEVSADDLANGNYTVPASWVVYRDTVDRRSKEVFGLTSRTKYYVATATLCEDSVLSQWSTLQFMTPCEAVTPEELGTVTFSNEEGFTSGDMPCWTVGSKTQSATSSYIPAVESTSSNMHNGNKYLKLYDYVSSSSSYVGAYAVMPELDVDSISKYQVNFWGRSYNSSSYNNQVIVGVVSDPTDLNTFVAVDTLNLSRTNWDPYSVGFENYEGDYMGIMGRNIMFLSDFGVTNYAYLSEISVDLIPKCRPVGTFSVDSVAEDAAVISWKGYQDSYRLMLAPKQLKDSEKPNYHYLLDTIVDRSENILITGLEPSSFYYAYVQGVCEDGDSTAISVTYATIHTTCPTVSGVPVPLFEDFESYENGEPSPGCWQIMTTGSRSMTYHVVREVSGNGTKAIDVWSTGSNGCYIVVPKVNADLATLKLSFDARSYGGGSSETKMYVGVMADIYDVSTFTLLETFDLTPSSAFTHCSMELGNYDLPYENLVITAGIPNVTSDTYDVYLDNIALELLASCNAPRLSFVGASFNSAQISLMPVTRTDTLFQLVVIPEAEYITIGNINSYLASAEKITVNKTSVELTDLLSATSYYIFARTICGEEDMSSWSRNPLKVSTRFYYTDSYSFGFEKTELWERSTASGSDNYYLHPALVTGREGQELPSEAYFHYPFSLESTSDNLYSRTGDGALEMYAKGAVHGGYIIFPAVGEASDRSFEFKLRNGYLDRNTMLPKNSEEAVVEIGTIGKDKDFGTYQTLATLRLEQLDPTKQGSVRSNNLHYKNYTLDLDSAAVATRQLVLYMPKQTADSVCLFVDDVVLGAPKGFSLVALKKVAAAGESALVEWQNIGGPWNLYIKDAAGQVVAQYLNLSGTTSQLVEDLLPQTDYTAVLEAASAPASAKNYVTSNSIAFRTFCRALEPDSHDHDFVWNFDNPYDWEANDILGKDANDSLYYKPSCFQVGITYDVPVNGNQWLIQRKGYEYQAAMTGYSASRHYETGRNDSHALRVHTTSNAFNSYIVLPELNCSFDTMMIEFYARCFANYDQTFGTAANRGRIVDAMYLGNAYSQSVVVGTLTDPLDFGTLQILDTLTYSHTDLTLSDNVNNDPDGLRYWELMRMPLTDAQGKFIVLFQPAPGLFFIDDLGVKPIGKTLFAPTGTQTSAITANSATLSWNTRQPDYSSVIVLKDAVGQEILRDTVSGNSYQLTDLQAAMLYEWYVFQTDGETNSPASKHVSFTTECVVITPAYSCSFEPEQGWQAVHGEKGYTQTLCWTYSDALLNDWVAGSFAPYNQPNTGSSSYSYSGSSAVMLRASYSARGTSYQPYIAMPAMETAAYDTLQVMFWIRPAYVSAMNDSVLMSYTGSTYSKSVIVGTMTDPADAATFVPIDTVTYDGTLSVADKATAANNFLFQQMRVELAGATGPYIAFMTSFQEKGGGAQKTGDYLWIDDISFAHRQECKDPTDLAAVQIGAYHATLTWNGVDSAGYYRLQVSTDPYFADAEQMVFDDFVEGDTVKVEHLGPLTTYVWRVQALCGEKWGESSFSQKATFKTSRSPYFLEEFNAVLNANEWTFSKSHADNIVDGTAAITRGLDTWSFTRVSNNNGLQGSHYAANGYSNDYHWLITPTFYLPEEDSVHFSMDLALTACNTAHTATDNAVTDNDMKDDYYFMIIISDDGGATWKSANILDKWQNTNPEGKQLRDIPATGMKLRYSLASYAGKNIRIGLYREARTTSNTGIAVHVDNVRLAYFDKAVEYASACQYEDVRIGDIFLSGDDTKPGIHSYPSPVYVSDAEALAGKRDSVYQLEIEVFPAQETFFADTICEGDTYSNYNFLPKEHPGVYRRKLHSVVHGCDSIVTLSLYVKPRKYAQDEEVAICPGDTYVWNDKVYNRAGIYRDTLVSSIGCDSVLTLVISNINAVEETIYDSSRVEMEELPFTYQNALHPYAEGQAPIYYPAGTPAGVYVDTVRVEGEQCATVLIHTLTVYNKHQAVDNIFDGKEGARKVIYRDNLYIILNDEWYNAAGQKVADPR